MADDPRQKQALLVQLPEPETEKPYTCAHCGTIITTRAERISRDGAHQHSFVNPHGIAFRIGCFRDAPGCVSVGEETGEHSWFPGYRWCYALCSGCLSHLGWRYSSEIGTAELGTFYGLILDELIQP